MNDLEEKIKRAFKHNAITISKSEDYLEWQRQVAVLGAKIKALKKRERRAVIVSFIKEIAEEKEIALSCYTVVKLIEKFRIKNISRDVIMEYFSNTEYDHDDERLVKRKEKRTPADKVKTIDYDLIHDQYHEELYKRLDEFDTTFKALSKKHRRDTEKLINIITSYYE